MNKKPPSTYRWIDQEWPGSGRPDHRFFDHTAHDLTELGDPPQRRFHMAMMDNGRRQITVLSTLRDGLFRNVRNSERRRWIYAVERAPLKQDDKRRVVAAAEEASVQWLRSELERPDSMLCVQGLTPGQQSEIGNLLLDLPYDFFRGDPANVEEDRAMVAESIVTGKRLVIGENRSSIRQLQLNRWLRDAKWIEQREWIRATDQVLRALEPVTCDDFVYVCALGAFLPGAPSNRDVKTIRRNADVLRQAGIPFAAMRIEQELDADPDVSFTFERMRETFPRRARATELRRVERVNEAAETEGYAKAPSM